MASLCENKMKNDLTKSTLAQVTRAGLGRALEETTKNEGSVIRRSVFLSHAEGKTREGAS